MICHCNTDNFSKLQVVLRWLYQWHHLLLCQEVIIMALFSDSCQTNAKQRLKVKLKLTKVG